MQTPRPSGQQSQQPSPSHDRPITDKDKEKEREREKEREEREKDKREREAAALRARKLAYFAKQARKHTLYVKFGDSLTHLPAAEGMTKDASGQIDNEAKAKQLAFYIFWNVKAYSRWGWCTLSCMQCRMDA